MITGQVILIAISLLGQFVTNLQDNGPLINASLKNHQYGPIEDLVIAEIEKLKEQIKDGIPEMGIPPLDPLVITSLPINLTMDGLLDADIHISETILTGLLNFNVTNLQIILETPPGIDFEITFNNMDISGIYELNGTLLQGLDVYGEGILFAGLQDFKIKGSIYLDQVCEMIVLGKFELSLNLNKADFFLTGFMNDNNFSKLIADELTNSLPDMINSSDLTGLATDLKTLLNKVLAFLQFGGSSDTIIKSLFKEIS